MPQQDIGIFTPEQARLVWQWYQRSSVDPGSIVVNRGPRPNGAQQPIQFYLGEAMAVAGNPRDEWTTARAFMYGVDDDGDLLYLMRQVVIVNRFTGVEGEAGQYGTAQWIGGQWLAQTLDCDVDADWEAPEALNIDAAPGPGDT